MHEDRSFKASDVSGSSVWIFILRFSLRTSDFKLQTLVASFANTVIANVAVAKLPNISGTYSVKAIQTKVKNDKNDLDCKCRLLEYDVLLYTHAHLTNQ